MHLIPCYVTTWILIGDVHQFGKISPQFLPDDVHLQGPIQRMLCSQGNLLLDLF